MLSYAMCLATRTRPAVHSALGIVGAPIMDIVSMLNAKFAAHHRHSGVRNPRPEHAMFTKNAA